MAWPNKGLVHRPVVMGMCGLVTSANALASTAGLRILLAGGNAVDAAVATAAALNVCEPYMSGVGGGYMLIYTARDHRLRVLDYNGPSPWAATPEAFATSEEKDRGPRASIVPGAIGGWLTALETAGTMDRETVFAPVIEYAARGVPITLKAASFIAAGGAASPPRHGPSSAPPAICPRRVRSSGSRNWRKPTANLSRRGRALSMAADSASASSPRSRRRAASSRCAI